MQTFWDLKCVFFLVLLIWFLLRVGELLQIGLDPLHVQLREDIIDTEKLQK